MLIGGRFQDFNLFIAGNVAKYVVVIIMLPWMLKAARIPARNLSSY